MPRKFTHKEFCEKVTTNLKKYRYTPKIRFGGSLTECFTLDSLNDIFKEINKNLRR